MAVKERLDIILTNRGFFDSREKARRSIMAGLIKVNGEMIDKPGTKVSTDAEIVLKGVEHPFVSRGGLKLLKAIETFQIDMSNKVVMDIGASTGGFTDCSLQYGAKEVYAVDVGYGQLAWSLRQDERVHVMERTNFRYLKKEDLVSQTPDFATIDVSFISLKTILAHLKNILQTDGKVVALVKPQFEAGKEKVGKKGIVKEAKIHKDVLYDVISFALAQDYNFLGLTYSPIKGGEGNIEFLLYLSNSPSLTSIEEILPFIDHIVAESHSQL